MDLAEASKDEVFQKLASNPSCSNHQYPSLFDIISQKSKRIV
jgi:hypothetical protein